MAKLYRLVKADGFCLRAFGLTLGVRVNQPAILNKIEARLPFGWPRLPSSRSVTRLYSLFLNGRGGRAGVSRFHLLYGDAQILARSETEEELLAEFERQINAHIFENCRTRCFVHAGVVGWNGKAIVMPGRTCAGKSSLVLEFLRRGATYYSDELAVFDRKGFVHAFPRALGIRSNAGKQTAVPATALAFKIGVQPLPVGLILLTKFNAAASWRPRATSPGKAVLALLRNALSGRANPALTLESLSAAVANAAILSGKRGEASDLVEVVLQQQTPSLGLAHHFMDRARDT